MTKGKISKVSVNRIIMVDVSLLFEINPSYIEPRFDKIRRSNLLDIWMDLSEGINKIKGSSLNPKLFRYLLEQTN